MNKIFNLNTIEEVAKEFLEYIGLAKVIGFSGNLGAGKTTFTKEILKQLGHGGGVPSPTFVLRRDYDLQKTDTNHIEKVIHIDAYRIEKPEEIDKVISKEELQNINNLIIIEWPEKVSPELLHKIFEFEHINETDRRISEKK